MPNLANANQEALILESCEKLVDLHAWPANVIDVRGWLSNFDDVDKMYAVHMVSQFLYFSDPLVNALFLSAFQNISINLFRTLEFKNDLNMAWNTFLSSCLVVPVQGEEPNPSDSGYLFARKARQILGIREEQLVTPESALRTLDSNPNIPIVFVDDFVGSGEQFDKTWRRPIEIGTKLSSYRDFASRNPSSQIYYCNAVVTTKGKRRIADQCPSVIMSTGNVLGSEYSWVGEKSTMWPNDMKNDGINFVEKYSKRLGYIDNNGNLNDWRGFHTLGLGLAFQHSTPDASLPFFYHSKDWVPLVTRT